MPPIQNDNQIVLDLLQNFNGLPSLKKLQAHLNMDREDAPISRRDWKEATRALLAADPVITASVGGSARELFGEEQSFKVIYCRLASPELLLTHERAVVTELLGQYPYALFVFSDQAQKRFHFLNVKDEPQGQKRRLFRRITVGTGERLRTAAEQLAKLDGEALKHLPLSGIQGRFDEAFDVGPVTKRFFAEYRDKFELVKKGIDGFAADQAGEEARNLFTQRLFNRLMFLAFIQKKRWLTYGGNPDYLCTLWTAHQRDTFANKGSFYDEKLKLLFFEGLGADAKSRDLIDINRGGFLKTVIGTVPYLNGGLFERDADDDNPNIKVPDVGLDAVINDLFERFNFTITESTPLDIEVAVDPEMLGKIFERLVTGRHESGSYYTPKPVVSFMCREALKGHLETVVPNERKENISRFVDHHDGAVDNPEQILDALRTVTICDPACGSGAYLLGMLHELLDLRQCLFTSRHIDATSVYDRKLEIIQKCIYGVDLDPFAVNIARLRLWLSLSVDFQGPVPLPLPNLDYKLSGGDSLTAPLMKGASAQSSFAAKAIQEFLSLKERHFNAHQQEKFLLKQQAEEKRKEVASWVWGSTNVLGFDWSVMYAEVFAVDGFDIIVANPPYVRADAKFKHIEDEDLRREAVQKWAKYRGSLIRSGQYQTLVEKWDLYIAFLERSMRLLKQGGLMAFIIPDAYNSNKYAEASHDFFLGLSTVHRIDFCSEVDIFDAGVSNTILLFQSGVLPEAMPLRALHRSPDIERFSSDYVVLESTSQELMGASLFRPQKRSATVTFEHVALSKICYISKGMVLHAHETKAPNEFKAEALISKTKDAKHPKAYVEGKDLRRWLTPISQYLEYGTKRSPAKMSRPTFPEMYDVPAKLISMDIASQQLRVTLDEAQLYHNHSAWSFVPWHALKGVRNRSIKKTALYKSEVTAATMPTITRDEMERTSKDFDIAYLAAIMNSSFAQEWLSGERRNKLHLYPDDWKLLPVPVASRAEQAAIRRMVVALRSGLKDGVDYSKIASLERQLDAAVNALAARERS